MEVASDAGPPPVQVCGPDEVIERTADFCLAGELVCLGWAMWRCVCSGEGWEKITQCSFTSVCFENACCEPDCEGRVCGGDGCGGGCGECHDGYACEDGTCTCVPSCDGRGCGPDHCDVLDCGTCEAPESCHHSFCEVEEYLPCSEGDRCGNDLCLTWGEVGWCAQECCSTACPPGLSCVYGGMWGDCVEGFLFCVPPSAPECDECLPSCPGDACGQPDGCGGTCHACAAPAACPDGDCTTCDDDNDDPDDGCDNGQVKPLRIGRTVDWGPGFAAVPWQDGALFAWTDPCVGPGEVGVQLAGFTNGLGTLALQAAFAGGGAERVVTPRLVGAPGETDLLAWTRYAGTTATIIEAAPLSADEPTVGEPIALTAAATFFPLSPELTRLSDGRIVAAWTRSADTNCGRVVEGRFISAAGQEEGPPMVFVKAMCDEHVEPPLTIRILALDTGGFAIASRSGAGLRLRLFDGQGNEMASPPVLVFGSLWEGLPALASLTGGAVVAVSRVGGADNDSLAPALYHPESQLLEPVDEVTVSGDIWNQVVIGVPDGGFVVVWTSDWSGEGPLKARFFTNSAAPSGEELTLLSSNGPTKLMLARLLDGSILAFGSACSGSPNEVCDLLAVRFREDGTLLYR